MKTRPLKMLLLALTLPFLAGCAIIDNILGTIALNLVFDSELLLNRVSMAGGEADFGSFAEPPISTDKRATITYGLDALIVPKSVSVSQMGFTIGIDFAVTYSSGAENLFYVEAMDMSEAGEDAPDGLDAAVQMLYPVGSLDGPESIEEIGNWLNMDRLFDLNKEPEKDVSITIKGTSGSKSKSKTFYFKVNSDRITLPGGGDVDIDMDYALVVEELGVEATLDVTIPHADLVAGKEIPLQVMWLDLADQSAASGKLSLVVDGLGDDFEVITALAYDNIDVTKNETLVEWTHTVKLKAGKPAPVTDLVVTYKALVSAN